MNTFLTSSLRLRGLPATLACLALGLAWPGVAAAQTTRTWSSTSTNPTWSVSTNWSGNTAPVANDSLAFASTTGSTSLTNNIAAGTTFNNITFNSGASAYTLSGNSITLSGSVVNNSSNAQTIALPLSLSSTRTFNSSSGNITISGSISGAGGLTKTGAGTLFLTGTNTFAGDITVSAGPLQVDGNGVLGTSGTYAGAINLASLSRINFTSNANQTLTGSIVSTGSNTDSIFFLTTAAGAGSGTVSLAMANPNFTSRLIVGATGATNASTLLLSHSNAVQNAILEPRSDNKIRFAPGIGTFNVGSLEVSGLAVGAVAGGFALTDTSGAAVTLSVGGNNRTAVNSYNGVLSGLGGLTKVGSGTLTLTGSNTYAGATTINGGLIVMGNGSALGTTGTITFGGGTLRYGQGINADLSLRVAASNSAIAVDTGTNSVTWASGLASTNAGGFTKLGSGTLTLSGSNTYTGTTTITAGQLSLSGGDNRLATTAPLTITGGVLDLGSRGQTTSGAISFQGGTVQSGTLTSTGGAFDGQAGTVSAILAGSVGLTKTTSGVLTLSGAAANTYSGTTTVSAGQLALNKTAGVNAVAGNLAITGGLVTFGTNNQIADTAAVTMSGSTSVFNGTGFNVGAFNLTETIGSLAVTGGAVNTGVGAITVTGTGTFDASTGYVEYVQNSGGSASFGGLSLIGMTGTTAVGTARTGFAVGGGVITSLTVGAGGLSLDGSNLLLQSSDAATAYGRLILNGNVTTAGSVASSIMTPASQAGIGRVELSGTAGTVSRTFTTAGGGADLTIAVPITNGIATTAGIEKAGAGVLTLSASNSFNGGSTVSLGTLRLGNANALGASTGALAVNGGTLDLGGFSVNVGALSGSAGAVITTANTAGTATLTTSAASNSTFGGTIQNNGSGIVALTKSGAGVLTFSGGAANTYSGTTTVSAGRLNLNKTAGVNAVAGNLAITGAAVSFGANNQIADTAAVTMSGSTSVFNGTGHNAGSVALTETIGSVAVTGGIFQTGNGAAITVTGTGTFDASTGYVEYLQNSGASASFGGLSLIGMTGTTAIGTARTGFAVGGSGLTPLTVGAGGLSLDGSNLLLQSANAATAYGRLTLNGNVTTAGSVASSIMTPAGQAGIGRVELSGTAGTVSRTFTTAAGGANLTIAVPISNGIATTAGIVKAGPGVLTLSASNSYTGATTVNAGSLLVNGLLAGLGAVTVDPGATLGGSGSIAGAVTVNGFLSPGTSPGLLSVASLVLGESSTSVFEIDGLTRATQYDGTDVTGALTYGGSLVIDFGSSITTAFADNTAFNLFDFGSQSGAFTSITTANDGSFYGGLTFASTGAGDKWTATKESQTLEFTHSTGNLVIVPEPAALALAAIGIAAASARVRYRRRK